MSLDTLPSSLMALILKYADYTILRGKIVRGNGFLERMIRRQLQSDREICNQCTSRILMDNVFLRVCVLHHWEKPEVYIYILNKATDETFWRKINKWGNI